MQAHKTWALVPWNHRLTVDLPSDFPVGEVEVIVLGGEAPARPEPATGPQAEADYHTWLRGILARVSAPALPDEAFQRDSIYDE